MPDLLLLRRGGRGGGRGGGEDQAAQRVQLSNAGTDSDTRITAQQLNRILTEFAEEIIDISVVEHCEALKQSEVAERLAHYQHKLSLHGAGAAAAGVHDKIR